MAAAVVLGVVLVAFLVLATLQLLNALAFRQALKDTERMFLGTAKTLMAEGKNAEAFEVMKAYGETVSLISKSMTGKK